MTENRQNDPLIGKRLGDYLIEALIGRGGMARVYRGYDENLGRLAAIKVLQVASVDNEDERIIERFKLEARAIARFEHPNIITVYQYGETQDSFFIAMKLVTGETLSQRLRQLRRDSAFLPPEMVLQITRDVCDALDYAHARGIIHRDVKPSNILFDPAANDRAILTDFGLAMELGGDSTMGTAFGTPRYIAPEQAVSSQKAVPQSDIYALGVVVYEMLTGQVPFQDESPMSIALYHITSEPPKPRSLNPDIPPQVEAVILRTLEKEPENRFKTAGDFYAALEKAYEDAAIDMPTPAVPQQREDKTPVFRDEERLQPILAAANPDVAPPAAIKAAAVPRQRGRARMGILPRIGLAAMFAVIMVGYWLLNGQSFLRASSVSNAIRDAVSGVASAIGDVVDSIGGGGSNLAGIPSDAELQFELIYNSTYFALHNKSGYFVPVDDLRIEWGSSANRQTYSGADFSGPIPPQQCSWIRLLDNGTQPRPSACPNPEYRLRMVDASDLIWAGYDSFRVMVKGHELATCTLAAGSCTFILPH